MLPMARCLVAVESMELFTELLERNWKIIVAI
jgi:hypothetical protein